MTVKQISVFVENTPGKIAEFTKVLYDNDINMRALSVADTRDFGILRVIADDSYKTACVLKDAGYVCSITKVLAVAIPDEPGALYKVLEVLGENDVNLEYMYAFNTRSVGSAYMIIRVADNDKAVSVLSKAGIKVICQEQLHKL